MTLTDLLIATRSSSTGPGSLWLYYNYTGTLDLIRETFTQSGSTTLNSDVDLANLTVTGRATFTILRDPFVGSASGGAVAPSGTFRIANYTDPDTSVISPITFLGTVSRIDQSGDFNGDGMVDAGDYDEWRNAFGSVSQLDADGNGDGVVDAADYVVWRKNLSSSAAGSGTSAALPEPASLTLFAMGGLLAFPRRRKSICNGKREHVPESEFVGDRKRNVGLRARTGQRLAVGAGQPDLFHSPSRLNSHIERTRQQQRKYALSAAIGMERSMKVQRISVLIAMLLLAAALVVASATRARAGFRRSLGRQPVRPTGHWQQHRQ